MVRSRPVGCHCQAPPVAIGLSDGATVHASVKVGVGVGVGAGSIALLLSEPLRVEQLPLDLVIERARARLLQPLQRVQTLYRVVHRVVYRVRWFVCVVIYVDTTFTKIL